MLGRQRYRLGRRGEAAEETRRRIVEATFALHAERGIASTSMRRIAERAGVSIGAVYHHFPTYEDAIRACGQYVADRFPRPTSEIFDGLASVQARVKRLAVEVFRYFDQVPAFERVRCDQDLIPLLRHSVEDEEQRRIALMCEALQLLEVEEQRVRTAAALLDVAVYRALRRAGYTTPDAAWEIAEVILSWLSHDCSSASTRRIGGHE